MAFDWHCLLLLQQHFPTCRNQAAGRNCISTITCSCSWAAATDRCGHASRFDWNLYHSSKSFYTGSQGVFLFEAFNFCKEKTTLQVQDIVKILYPTLHTCQEVQNPGMSLFCLSHGTGVNCSLQRLTDAETGRSPSWFSTANVLWSISGEIPPVPFLHISAQGSSRTWSMFCSHWR